MIPVRRTTWAGLFAALCASCTCGAPPVVLTDAGPGCETDAQCPSGQRCLLAACVDAPTADSGLCEADTDCPPGTRCLRSTGQCVAPMDAGGPVDFDAGEPEACVAGQTMPCGVSKVGTCRLGVRACETDGGPARFGACVGAVLPVDEVCNGLDDDCDGETDDGFGTDSCGVGACARSVPTCVGGVPATCTPGASIPEACNGVDDDCNGMTDEGLPTQSCGVGACRRTVATCDGGVAVTCTPGQATAEVCNGLDDDCDGTPDDGFGDVSCGQGVCARTQASCVAGMPRACMPGTAGTELCDTLDNDCDGEVDEGCACTPGTSRGCYGGPAGTADAGVCRTGTQSCLDGGWGSCAGQVLPGTETCNGLDDDCDGTRDDGLGNTSCGIGACARTVAACLNGAPQTCSPGMGTAETCNGQDDNCNGAVDDGLPAATCGVGACARSVPSCVNGMAQTCTPGMSTAETCNGVDDNCNGSTDETFPQSGQPCTTTAQGLCAMGAYTCVGGALSCAQTRMPTPEVCGNGLDEDCNGQVDDGPACCMASVDRDADGRNACVDCNDNDGAIFPGATELCDGKDNDCDGAIDEGFDGDGDGFTRCGTRASGGGLDPLRVDCNDLSAFVFPLKTTDCGNMATPGTPNSVDDNCNGYTDETCGCRTQDRDGDGLSECQGDCADNDATVAPNRPEVCDGKDNDCNKATTANCGVSQNCGVRQGPSWVRFPAGTDECRPDLVCVSNLSTGELTCGSFCNQTTGVGLGDSCAANEGCLRNLVDSDNQHLCSVTTVGAAATGQACTQASQCRSGDCLTTDGPTDYCTDKCTHEAGCSANTSCAVNESPITSGPFQIGTYLWSSCRLDSNLTGTRTTGQSCSAAQPCRLGALACHDGGCVEPCCQHADCAAGSSCSVLGPRRATGYQTAAMEPIHSVLPSCLPSGAATKVSGQACATSAECRSGLCQQASGTCADLCCNDTSCPNGTTCELTQLKLATGQVTLVRACLFSPVPPNVTQR